MPGMKVTLSAAMRARDVSRPQAEHEEAARRPPNGPGRRGRQGRHRVPGQRVTPGGEPPAAAGRSRDDTGGRPMATPKSVGGRPRRKRH